MRRNRFPSAKGATWLASWRGFSACVVLPALACFAYLNWIATPQYYSFAGFTTRGADHPLGAEGLAGALVLGSTGQVSENEILYSYLQSLELAQSVDAAQGLQDHYSKGWRRDPVFLLPQAASQEDIHAFWQRILDVSFDRSSGLIELRLRARTPEFAQRLLQEVIAHSDRKINDINKAAYNDALRFAQTTLDEAKAEWAASRAAMQAFRQKHGIVDPSIEIESRMGVLASMQQELANALIDYDELRQTTGQDDPRVRKLGDRVDVIRARLATERAEFYGVSGQDGLNFPELVSGFEALSADLEFAELSYTAALAALDAARVEAIQKSRYLAVYLPPSRAETAEFAKPLETTALASFFAALIWLILVLFHLSVRGRP